MLPGSVGALLLLFALIPGWLHQQLMKRTRLRGSVSALEEVLELVAVGLLTTGVPLVVLALLPPQSHGPLVDIGAWVREGSVYFGLHLRRVAASSVLLLAVACALAWGLYRIRCRGRRGEYEPSMSIWTYALGDRPKGKTPYVCLSLKDGREVEGQLASFSLSESAREERDIALGSPIKIKGKGASEAVAALGVERLIVNAADIHLILVAHVNEQ